MRLVIFERTDTTNDEKYPCDIEPDQKSVDCTLLLLLELEFFNQLLLIFIAFVKLLQVKILTLLAIGVYLSLLFLLFTLLHAEFFFFVIP